MPIHPDLRQARRLLFASAAFFVVIFAGLAAMAWQQHKWELRLNELNRQLQLTQQACEAR